MINLTRVSLYGDEPEPVGDRPKLPSADASSMVYRQYAFDLMNWEKAYEQYTEQKKEYLKKKTRVITVFKQDLRSDVLGQGAMSTWPKTTTEMVEQACAGLGFASDADFDSAYQRMLQMGRLLRALPVITYTLIV